MATSKPMLYVTELHPMFCECGEVATLSLRSETAFNLAASKTQFVCKKCANKLAADFDLVFPRTAAFEPEDLMSPQISNFLSPEDRAERRKNKAALISELPVVFVDVSPNKVAKNFLDVHPVEPVKTLTPMDRVLASCKRMNIEPLHAVFTWRGHEYQLQSQPVLNGVKVEKKWELLRVERGGKLKLVSVSPQFARDIEFVTTKSTRVVKSTRIANVPCGKDPESGVEIFRQVSQEVSEILPESLGVIAGVSIRTK